MPLMRCVSNTAKTSMSSGVTWNSQSQALGPGGDQAVSSRPSDQRQRTPDGRTCCDGNVAWRIDGWQNGAAGDWQLLMLECNIRLDTAEPAFAFKTPMHCYSKFVLDTFRNVEPV